MEGGVTEGPARHLPLWLGRGSLAPSMTQGALENVPFGILFFPDGLIAIADSQISPRINGSRKNGLSCKTTAQAASLKRLGGSTRKKTIPGYHVGRFRHAAGILRGNSQPEPRRPTWNECGKPCAGQQHALRAGRTISSSVPARFSWCPSIKWLFSPISLLGGNFNPRNINPMPAVKLSARIVRDENISFLDGH